MIGSLEEKIKRDIWKEIGIDRSLEFKPKFIHYKKVPMQKVSHIGDINEKRRIAEEITKIENKNSTSGKKNIGRIGCFIYNALFGGEIFLKGVDYDDGSDNPNGVKIKPDNLVYNAPIYKKDFIEVKTVCKKGGASSCSKSQIEKYCYNLLNEWIINRNVNCFSDYAFFRYGDRNTVKTHKIRKHSKMLDVVCNIKDLLITPLNLTLFLFENSSLIDFNQETSKAGGNNPCYRLLGGTKTILEKGMVGLQKMINDYESGVLKDSKRVNDLFLDRLKFLQVKSPEITYKWRGKNSKIEPFTISKYYLDRDDFHEFREHFIKNYPRILENLDLKNVFQENLYREEKSYMESIRIAATEEGISFKEALEKYGPFVDEDSSIEDIPF